MKERRRVSRHTLTTIILASVMPLLGCLAEGGIGGGSSSDEADEARPDGGVPGQVDQGESCQDVTCSSHGTCTMTDGTARCECEDGYEASGLTCTPLNADATGCLEGGGDYTVEGPYGSAKMAGPFGYTVYYPATWDDDCLHPFGAWGNGTGVIGSWVYEHLNAHVASWGIVVIASQEPMTLTGLDHRKGLDWLIEQNANPESPLFGRLSERAGVAGHSQGGIGASAAASHPNVVAEVNIEGGGYSNGRATLLLTGTLDFMRPSIELSWWLSNGPTFLASHGLTSHIITPSVLGAETPGGIQVKRLYAAWYRCFLADDATACELFTGDDECGICDEPEWFELRSKNL